MINQTFIHTKLHSANSYAALTEQAKAALLTSKSQLGLNVGDLLEGNLVKVENKFFLRELVTGQLFATNLIDEHLLGQLLKFEVKGYEGTKLLLALSESTMSQNTLIEQAMDTLDLPREEGIKQLIKAFTDAELPLQKEPILQTYRLQQVTELPGQAFLNILKYHQGNTYAPSNIPIGHETLKQMGNYKEDVLKEVLDQTLEAYSRTIEENKPMANKTGVLQSFLKGIQQTLPETVFKAVLQNLMSETGILKEEGHTQLDKVSTSKLIETLVKQLDEMPLDESLKKCLKACFTLDSNTLRQASKQAKGLKDTVLFKEEEIVKVLVKEMKQLSGNSQGLEKMLNELEEQLLIHHKLKEEGQYYTFPFMSELGEAKGKVYFYKPYKNKQKQDKSLYTVIALEMPTLKEIEVHIHQIDKNLRLDFYTELEAAKKLIEAEGYRLLEPLGKLGYQVEHISFAKKEDREVIALQSEEKDLPLPTGFDYHI